MAWIALTSTKLKELMAGAEFTAVTSAARAAGQEADTLVDNALARVVQTARGYIGRRYSLGPDGTVPDEVEGACLDMARVNVLTRLPNLKTLLSKERTQAAKDGYDLLRAISRGEFVIVESDTPADSQPGAPVVAIINKRTPRYDADALGRLM